MNYSVLIKNLCATTTTAELKDLFKEIQEILDIWINRKYKKITYGFAEFSNLYFAEEACRRFDGHKLNFSQIQVRLSDETKRRMELRVRRPNNSILLEMPKKTKPCKSHLAKVALLKTLRENKDIHEDFQKACLEVETIAFPNKCEIVYTAPEQTNLKTLETTITRYFKPTKKKTLQVDFDLLKGKLLTNEQYDKFFNIQFTESRKPKTKPKKKKIPIALDYRSVVDKD